MQKLNLKQELSHKLSLKQIQFVKLLQIPSDDIHARINRELEDNPLLEKNDHADHSNGDNVADATPLYRLSTNNYQKDEQTKTKQIQFHESLQSHFLKQLKFLQLDDRGYAICKYIIGSIDTDGYIRQSSETISDDLALMEYLEVDIDEIERYIKLIQKFEPSGIASRDLRECLLLQINSYPNRSNKILLAEKIIKNCFKEFVYKHFNKILQKLNITSKDELKESLSFIKKLNPRPGRIFAEKENTKFVYPDFIVKFRDGSLDVKLAKDNLPELSVKNVYSNIQSQNENNKELESFVNNKLNAARWFIEAINQRQKTLLNTMNSIVKFQRKFFEDEDEVNLKPMILKDIAQDIKMDISTVSRVVSNKFVQTDSNIYSLKFFFSEGIKTFAGNEVSSKEVKEKINSLIASENKLNPLTDEQISIILEKKGYQIARRTVAKYREQLKIPVTRLRKDVVIN